MTTVKIPDLGGASQVEIIEILVQNGDSVSVEQPLLVLETDKATMEIPADQAGVIRQLLVQVGDKVSSGDAIAELETGAVVSAPATVTQSAAATVTAAPDTAPAAAATSEVVSIPVPDLGGSADVPVIEWLVQPGDRIDAEQTVAVLESDKATMEIPAGRAGTVVSLAVQVGDKVSTGSALLVLRAEASAVPEAAPASAPAVTSAPAPVTRAPAVTAAVPATAPAGPSGQVHAGPAVRKLARELGVDLALVAATGARGRIQKDDVHAYVKQQMQAIAAGTAGGSGIPAVPEIDFSQFGPVSRLPLNNIKRATARAMTIANLNVPQVTQFDLADITDLEAYRLKQNERFAKEGIRFSLVPFVLKALARCLRDFPTFNASLAADGETLILKDYVHLGVAVDTPKGLLVPVLRNVDQKSVTEITQELQEKAALARQGKLSLTDMQGGCLSLSSLGGIGGTAFTPIVNPPDVAILGLSKSSMQPVWDGQNFVPRLMLPLSLSYDHRVIDGAEAARFSQKLVSYLQDLRDTLM